MKRITHFRFFDHRIFLVGHLSPRRSRDSVIWLMIIEVQTVNFWVVDISDRSSMQFIWCEILRWFRIWSQNYMFAHPFKRKTRFKRFAWADTQNFYFSESVVKFWFAIYPSLMKLKSTSSRIGNVPKIEFLRLL